MFFFLSFFYKGSKEAGTKVKVGTTKESFYREKEQESALEKIKDDNIVKLEKGGFLSLVSTLRSAIKLY